MPPLKPPQARKGKEFSGRDSAANEREKPDLDAPIVWDAAELEDLRFGATVGLSLTGVVLAVYVRTMHPTIAGGDSGELMGAACELGVAHPPGYPLFTMVSWLGTQIIPFGSPGYRLNLVSVLFAAAATFFHFHAVLRWHLALSRATPPPPSSRPGSEEARGGVASEAAAGSGYRGSAWAAVMASGLLSFSPLIWQYSTHAEVFAMNNTFLALLLFLSVRFVQERRVADCYWGALVIGLGLSNQHTLLLYALPIVAWMLWHGRKELLKPAPLLTLALLGLLGLTPYLYLFWAATHAGMGSWGDTSTLSGWPAVGFWTHFFRKEYGTFALYSGKEGERNQLQAALTLYTSSTFAKDSLFTAWAAVIGVGVGFRKEGWRGVSAIALSAFLFYMIVFHSLANLPLDKPLYLGVHMRFWMQPHIVLFAFIGIGLACLLSFANLWRPTVAPVLAILLVGLQVARNFETMDQSNNLYIYNFGKDLLEGRGQNAVLFTQGDLVTNSIRYLQRCEKKRLDVAHLDMPMMTYEWFKTRHVPHMPSKIVFPGMQFSVNAVRLNEHRGCCPFSMKQLLDANIGTKVGNATRPFYLIGGWYGQEGGTAEQMIPGYHAEPIGMGARITRANKRLKTKEFKEEIKGFKLRLDLPDATKYDETTWERTILENYINYGMAVNVQRMDRAVAKGKEDVEGSSWIKEQGELKKCLAGLDTLVAIVRGLPMKHEMADLFRNTAIAYGRLKCPRPDLYPTEPCPGQDKMREMMTEFLRVTKKTEAETETERIVVNNPTKFINLG